MGKYMANRDEKLTEKEALAQAKADGIEFVDEYHIEGKSKIYSTRAAAQKAASKGDNVVQTRRRKA
jgi:hypothetical protein